MKKYICIAFACLLHSLSLFSAGNVVSKELNSGWKFRQYNLGAWLPAAVPGTVHTDLMNAKKIEDPFYRNNEEKVQWIDKVNWEYETHFQLSDSITGKANQQLVFYGLDTWCDVFLNGEKIASPDNMFRTWKIDVKDKLHAGGNRLNIRFYSPVSKGLEAMENYGLIFPASNDYSQFGGMGDVRVSIFARKAPYHFGWDWGPRLVTSGIWRPVEVEAWDNLRLQDVFIRQPSVDHAAAKLEAEITVSADRGQKASAEILLDNKVIAATPVTLASGSNRISIPFAIKNPRLWWSNGLGRQNLYKFQIRIRQNNQTVAQKEITTGLRSLKLVRKKDSAGESFGFELNGVPVFAKGTNSIPNDIFLPRITPADYEKMVRDAADANMNMIRIWGGGIYEDDYFYDMCDKYGIMVWQDFAFACAMYPGNPEFLESVKQEAIDNVVRLRNHPSLALWCGNNEIDIAWTNWGWKKGYTSEQQSHITKAYTDIFHKILPEVVAAHTDGDNYWPSSPMSGPEINDHEKRQGTSGDNHYWGVWHEKHKFSGFEENIGRFISEYGFQSFPEFETVKKYAIPEDYDIESEVMAAHQRSGIGNLRIKEYMGWYYNVPEDFEQFLYMSQVLQGQAMRTAMEAHRRAMPYCMGSLTWQLNDCWPVASWSTTDYYHNWKAAHYALREACKPVALAPKTDGKNMEIWIVNDNLAPAKGHYTLELFDFDGRPLNKITGKYSVKANASQRISALSKEAILKGCRPEEVVAVLALHNNKELIDEQTFFFTEHKNLKLPRPEISLHITEENGKRYLQASADKLACNVMFYVPEKRVFFSDNYKDLLPGRQYKIEIRTDVPTEQIKPVVRYIQ